MNQPDAKSVFGRAAEINDPFARAAYLDEACADRPAVRAEVETLLRALGNAGSFMRSPVLGPDATIDQDNKIPEGEGTVIGPYTIREQIGEGGMGLVFVAEQTHPVRRKVALKVIKPGMDTKQVVARFEAERQALALMEHPNIAKVLDAGTTASGLPYFVMELVRGVPINEYCDANKLIPKQRLELFVQVCHAVQHAHQKGIIHRDLKPSNILVTSHDGVPITKVIDFGVAKAIGQTLTEKTIYTRFAQMIGTPLYMSPEQAEFSGLDVDTRSDVYALGVVLYELLTGTTPFDGERFRKAAFDEMRRIIKEEEPPRPSTRLTSLGATLTAVSAKRGTDPGKLAGVLRGELDWIVMRCLEKDRTRRYDGAAALVKDVQRYLAGDAVEACPPTLGYRLRKAYRRNRTALQMGGAFALLLTVGIITTTVFAVLARRAEQTASEQAKAALLAQHDADKQRTTAIAAAEQSHRSEDVQRRTRYAAEMNLLQAAYDAKDNATVMRLLKAQIPANGETDLRGPEWNFWERKFHSHETEFRVPCSKMVIRNWARGSFHGIGLSPDGGTAVVAQCGNSGGVTIQVWNAVTHERRTEYPLVHDLGPPIHTHAEVLRFSSDGQKVVVERRITNDEWGIMTGNYSRRAYLIRLADGVAEPIEDAETNGIYTATEFSDDLSVAVFRRIDIEKKQTHLHFQRLEDRKDLGKMIIDGYSSAVLTKDHGHVLVRSLPEHDVFEPKNFLPQKRSVDYSYWKLGEDKPLWRKKQTELADGRCRLSHDGRLYHRLVFEDSFWRLQSHEVSSGREFASQIVAGSSEAERYPEATMPPEWVLSSDEQRIAYQTRNGLAVCDLGVARQIRPFSDGPVAPSRHLVESFELRSNFFSFLPDGRLAVTWSGFDLWTNTRMLSNQRWENSSDFVTENLLIRTWRLPKFGAEADTGLTSIESPDRQMYALAPRRRLGTGPTGKITDRICVVKVDGTVLLQADLRTRQAQTTDYDTLIASVGFSADNSYIYYAGEFAGRWELALKVGDPFIVWDIPNRKEAGRIHSPPGTTFFNNRIPKLPQVGDRVLFSHYRNDTMIEGGINGNPTPRAAGGKVIEFPSCRTLFDITIPDTVHVDHFDFDTTGIIVGYADSYLGRSDGKTVPVHEWDGKTGRYRGPSERKWPIIPLLKPEPQAEKWMVHGDRAVRVIPEGKSVAEVWDANRRGPQDQPLFRVPINDVCELNPDGTRLLVSEFRSRTQSDAVLYCTKTGRILWSRSWPYQMSSMAKFAKWSPDGQQFWYGVDADGKPVGWDFHTMKSKK